MVGLLGGGLALLAGVGDPELAGRGLEQDRVQVRLHGHRPVHQVPGRFGVERAVAGLHAPDELLVAVAAESTTASFTGSGSFGWLSPMFTTKNVSHDASMPTPLPVLPSAITK